jgi:SAM-dependent methyltransferase
VSAEVLRVISSGARSPLHRPRALLAVLLGIGAALSPWGCSGAPQGASAPPGAPEAGEPGDLAPFVPSPMPVVRRMLEVAGVTSADVVYDLGAGDGRIVIEAAKRHGARGVGIEYDRRLCDLARARAEREGVADKVEIRHEDVMVADFSEATVITLYLLPSANERLLPRLQALRPGTRVVSHDYRIGDWKPLLEEVVPGNDAFEHVVRLWRVGEGE